MDRYYGFIIPITFHSFITFPEIVVLQLQVCLSMYDLLLPPGIKGLCLKAFKETNVSKDLSRLFHNEGPIYDKALKP